MAETQQNNLAKWNIYKQQAKSYKIQENHESEYYKKKKTTKHHGTETPQQAAELLSSLNAAEKWSEIVCSSEP